MKNQKIQFANFFYKILIYLVRFSSPVVFHDVKIYFPDKKKILPVPYPTVLYANHVVELDVTALGTIFPYIKPKIRFTFPMRQDISERDFLTKEFHLKGFIGFILKLIDKTNFIPWALNFLGGIPIKRPFRDDARKLIKSGQLEKIIDDQWRVLAKNLLSGNNLFLFPEGKFGYTGNLDPIRKGIWILGNHIQDLNFNSITLTYDFLSYKKPVLHISVGENKKINIPWEEKEVGRFIKQELGNQFVITPGNLFSFSILNLEYSGHFTKNGLIKKIMDAAKSIQAIGKLKISCEFFQENIEGLIEGLIEKAIQRDFILLSEGYLQGTEKLQRTQFPNLAAIKKLNPYYYHANQLNFFKNDLNDILDI